jgi:hypothetical protein
MISDATKQNVAHIEPLRRLIEELEVMWPSAHFREQTAFTSGDIKQSFETTVIVDADFENGYLRHYKVTKESIENLIDLLYSQGVKDIRIKLLYKPVEN